MADIAVEDLQDRIRPYVPACPIDLVSQALRDVVRDFFTVTRAWIHEDTDTIVADQAEYVILLPSDQVEAVSIEHMTVDEADAKFREVEWLNKHIANWRLRVADDFRYFTQLKPGTFRFAAIPETAGTADGVAYDVAVRPILDATGIEELYVAEFMEVWSAGVLAKLKAIPNKPWSDLGGVKMQMAAYSSGRGAARIRASKSYGSADQRWSNPRGFA